MKENRSSLSAVGFYLIIIGFINNNHHHKFNYIEKLFFWYSFRGEPVKATCYNLMIPIQTNNPTGLIMDYNTIYDQKEIIQPNLLEIKLEEKLKLTDYIDVKTLIKKYLLSFVMKLIRLKACKKLNAFRGKNSNRDKGKKIPPLVEMPNLKPMIFVIY